MASMVEWLSNFNEDFMKLKRSKLAILCFLCVFAVELSASEYKQAVEPSWWEIIFGPSTSSCALAYCEEN